MQNIDWEHIHFNELDIILRINTQDNSVIDEEISRCATPLILACKFKREDLLTVLLYHGARTDTSVASNKSLPLHYACSHTRGNLGMVRKLLEAKADIDAQDSDGCTGLHLACKMDNIPVVELLIEHGASVNLGDSCGDTPLVVACRASLTHLVDILLKAGSDPDVLDGYPMEVAIYSSSLTLFNLLVAAGAHLVGRGYLGLACMQGHLPMIKALLEIGADINEPNPVKMTPLHLALTGPRCSINIVQLLLERGADIHTMPSPLHVACDKPDTAKIKLLLAYGADVNVTGDLGCSPLMKLVFYIRLRLLEPNERHVRTVRLLIAAGSKFSHGPVGSALITDHLLGPMTVELKAVLDELGHTATNPPDLQFLCRIVIRKSVAPNKDEHIAKLPLPLQIIRYLTFDEIE